MGFELRNEIEIEDNMMGYGVWSMEDGGGRTSSFGLGNTQVSRNKSSF